jgi:serine/threonine protein kinase/DNA-binding CsgD family transcriptional regulator
MNLSFKAGTVLVKKYRVEAQIGRGGFGAVYRATDLALQRTVAIKTLLWEQEELDRRYGKGTFEEYIRRFEREARVSSYFTANPNIITVHNLEYDEQGHYYLVMEYLEGGSLLNLLRQEGALPLEQVLRITRDLCAALGDIHHHPAGIVHRDLKPGNILLRANGQAVLADFGIAQVGQESQRELHSRFHPGSLAYASPEQKEITHYLTPASDLYALGLLVYEMLTGEPFNEAKRPAIKTQARIPVAVGEVLQKLLNPQPEERYQQAGEVWSAVEKASANVSKVKSTSSNSGVEEATRPITAPFRPVRIFIIYRPGLQPDEGLAEELAKVLGQQANVFLDYRPELLTEWATHLEQELQQADFVIALLSAQAVQSEMVTAEIAKAAGLAKEYAGKPQLLPVRVVYQAEWPYPLRTLLESVNWTSWESEQDTPRLIEQIRQALVGQPLPAAPDRPVTTEPTSPFPAPAFSAPLELPEGTMKLQSPFYVTRPSDLVALQTIAEQGVTITIKGPRQMGKSSLLVRVAEEAQKLGKRVALLDFQFVDTSTLDSAEIFLRQFCSWLSFTLKLDDQSADYWRLPLGNIQRCTSYLEDYLLPEVGGPLVLALDEVDKIFDTPFRSDFFGMLRGWHNRRYTASEWQQLDLVLVTSTEPYQLVANLNQSPFNVGQVIELEDFSAKQLHDLNQRHGLPFSSMEEARLMSLLNGQPYLMRRALYLVASRRLTSGELFATATAERGPFGDHLRYHLFRLHRKTELVKGLWQVIQHNSLNDEELFFRLQGAGLVRREGRKVVPRCQLYADYFHEHLPALNETTEKILTPALPQSVQPVPVISPPSASGLSSREVEVLRLVVAGLTNAQIAAKLAITPGTVNVHLSTIYSKLGVSSRTAAMRYAIDKKLV